MTLHELLEAAQLDALGLLDAEEQQAFEKAFVAAAPAVRDQVRREQSRLCRLESVLPDVAPAADLRQRVLSAVAAAQAAETLSELSGSPLDGATLHGTGRNGPAVLPERRVSRLWRASAVGMAAAAVVFGITTIQLRNEYTQLAKQIEDQTLMNDLVLKLGAEHVSDFIFDQSTRRVVFAPADPSFRGQATMWLNADWEKARFFAKNLPTKSGSSYRLVALDRAGKVTRQLVEFDADRGMLTHSIEVDPAADYALALIAVPKGDPTAQGQTVLTTPPLATMLATGPVATMRLAAL